VISTAVQLTHLTGHRSRPGGAALFDSDGDVARTYACARSSSTAFARTSWAGQPFRSPLRVVCHPASPCVGVSDRTSVSARIPRHPMLSGVAPGSAPPLPVTVLEFLRTGTVRAGDRVTVRIRCTVGGIRHEPSWQGSSPPPVEHDERRGRGLLAFVKRARDIETSSSV